MNRALRTSPYPGVLYPVLDKLNVINRLDLYNEEGNDREWAIPLNSLDIGGIDMLLLLTHFKGKYGNAGPNNQTTLPG